MKSIGVIIAAGLSVCPVGAKLVTKDFTGELLNNAGLTEEFTAEFPAGTRWTLQVEWDDEQAPLFVSESQSQWTTSSYTLIIEGVSGPWTCRALEGKSTFGLNEFGSTDEIQFTSSWGPENHSNPDLAGYPVYSINLVLTHSMGEAIDGVATVPSQINLDDWMLNISELKIYVNDAGFPVIKGSIDGDVTVTEEGGRTGLILSGKNLKSGKSTVSLGKAKIGGKATSRSLVIRNEGLGVLEGLNVKLDGKAHRDFRVRMGSASGLNPSEKARIKVFFKPKKSGVRKAKLKVASSDPQSPFVIQLKGRGL